MLVAASTQSKKHDSYHNADTRLADRAATLNPGPSNQQSKSPRASPNPASGEHSHSAGKQLSAVDRDALNRVQEDLSEAQRSRGVIQLQLQGLTEETKRLRLRSKADSRRISELISERTHLATRMRDRDEELRGKAKLLEVSPQYTTIKTRCETLYVTVHRMYMMKLYH